MDLYPAEATIELLEIEIEIEIEIEFPEAENFDKILVVVILSKW